MHEVMKERNILDDPLPSSDHYLGYKKATYEYEMVETFLTCDQQQTWRIWRLEGYPFHGE